MNVGDVLGAASLLATVVAILYSLWYPEISAALRLDRPPMRDDRDTEISDLGKTIWTKALPLAVISGMPPVVFAPDVLGLIGRAVTTLTLPGGPRFSYNSIDAAFVVVWLLMVILAVVAESQLKALWLKRRDFEGQP